MGQHKNKSGGFRAPGPKETFVVSDRAYLGWMESFLGFFSHLKIGSYRRDPEVIKAEVRHFFTTRPRPWRSHQKDARRKAAASRYGRRNGVTV